MPRFPIADFIIFLFYFLNFFSNISNNLDNKWKIEKLSIYYEE